MLARASIAYAVMCVVYLLLTRDLGTPLKDSLTPEQRDIKRASANERKQRAIMGLVVGLVVAQCVPLRRIAA